MGLKRHRLNRQYNKKENEQNNLTNSNDKIEHFDFAIIGAGLAGITLANILYKNEFKVLLIDKEEPGIKSSLNVKNFLKVIKYQIKKNELPQDFIAQLPSKINYINKEQNEEILKYIKTSSYVSILKGEAKNISDHYLNVNNKKYHFKNLVFATGSYYDEQLKYDDLDKTMYLNIDQINTINTLYESIAIYGTNIDAIEIGYSLSKLGVKVHFFDKNVNPFNDFDDELEAILKTEYSNYNIVWHLESEIKSHKRNETNQKIDITYNSHNENKTISVDKIILVDNKKPNTKNIDCIYDITLNSKGAFVIDNTFKLKDNPNFYAIGDCNGINMIPSQSTYQAITLANYFSGQKSARFLPKITTFTIDVEPEIAFYGMNKHEIELLGTSYNEFIYDFNKDLTSKLFSQKGKIKIYTNQSHEILGVFLFGDKIKELLPIFIEAINNKTKFHKLAYMYLPFYSKAEAIREAALDYKLEFVGLGKKIQKMRKKALKKEEV